MDDILTFIIDTISFCFSWLANINVLGTNLLVLLITIALINLLIPVLINLPKNKGGRGND